MNIVQNTYLVGGAVRDRLLGLANYDKDWVVVGASVEQMLDAGFKPVGKDFPVFLHPQTKDEYALARTERKTAIGYQGFEFNTSTDVTLEEDLERRDLTINAIAQDESGNLIDPYGGQKDLESKTLRHISPAFAEDPVRVLRVARFAAKFDFSIAEETMELMRAMVLNGEVDALVAERIWQEMLKALSTDTPHRFFEVLRECGALRKVLPEVDCLFGIPQTAKYHPEIDCGVHTMMVIEQAAKLTEDTRVRFTALVHDLGKGMTPASILPSHRGHERTGLPLVEQVCQRLKVPKSYKSLALAVTEFHLHMHKMMDLRAKTVLNMLQKTGSLKDSERAHHVAMCCTADAKGRAGFEERDYPQAQLFLRYREAAATIDTKAIIGDLTDGKKIQRAIAKAQMAAIKDTKRNNTLVAPTHG